MGEKLSYQFDLPALLRSGNLDIRRVATNNLSLTAGEYFKLLSNFINFAPQAMDSLNKIAVLEGDEFDFHRMVDIKNLLEDIGCVNFLPVLDDIIKTSKRGHEEFAADCVNKISDEFSKVYTQIMAAKKTETPEILADALGESVSVYDNLTASYGTHSLKKVLRLLDQEEATRKLRILAIDDAPVMLKTISSVLSDEYKVFGMTDPTKLEVFLQQITPELFLLDYKMPERSGFDLVPVIRSYEDHKNTPIIFLTSLGTPDYVSAALTLGACDFIVKPFQGNILREKVTKHIVRKKLF